MSVNLSQHQHPSLSAMLRLSWDISGVCSYQWSPSADYLHSLPRDHCLRTSCDVWWPWDPGYWLSRGGGLRMIKNVTADAAARSLSLTSLSPLCWSLGGLGLERRERYIMTVSNTTTMSDLCRQYFIIIWFIWFFAENESSLVTCNQDDDEKVGEKWDKKRKHSVTFYCCQHNSLMYSSKKATWWSKSYKCFLIVQQNI